MNQNSPGPTTHVSVFDGVKRLSNFAQHESKWSCRWARTASNNGSLEVQGFLHYFQGVLEIEIIIETIGSIEINFGRWRGSSEVTSV